MPRAKLTDARGGPLGALRTCPQVASLEPQLVVRAPERTERRWPATAVLSATEIETLRLWLATIPFH